MLNKEVNKKYLLNLYILYNISFVQYIFFNINSFNVKKIFCYCKKVSQIVKNQEKT